MPKSRSNPFTLTLALTMAQSLLTAINLTLLGVFLPTESGTSGPAALAQSLTVTKPAALSAGINRGTVDSFIGAHYWAFTAQPGAFKITFIAGNPAEGFSVGSKAHVEAAFGPNKPGCKMTAKTIPAGMLFEGSVTTPSRVVVMVEPANSPLVRQSTDYSIEIGGSVGDNSISQNTNTAGGAPNSAGSTLSEQTRTLSTATGPSVVGVYNVKINSAGFAKFLADGTILTSGNEKGNWELFDADTRSYVITLMGNRYNVTFQPGRGFVDANNGNLYFEAKAPAR